MLTAATESHLGTYIRQENMLGDRGAFGIFQMEKPSYDRIWANLILNSSALKAKVRLYTGYDGKPPVQRMITDLSLATILARLYYLEINAPLPKANDAVGLATYWKKYWNTEAGKGTVEKAQTDYENYCK